MLKICDEAYHSVPKITLRSLGVGVKKKKKMGIKLGWGPWNVGWSGIFSPQTESHDTRDWLKSVTTAACTCKLSACFLNIDHLLLWD